MAGSAGARSADLYLEASKGSNVPVWEATGSSTQAARVRIGGGVFSNQCWAIPQLANPANPPFPYFVALKDCGKADLKFFVE